MNLYKVPDGSGGFHLIWADSEEDLYLFLKEEDMEEFFGEHCLVEDIWDPERGFWIHVLDSDW